MLLTRIIPALLIEDECLVKTKKFKSPRYLGDPINAVTIFNEKEVDEILILDIGASKSGPNFRMIESIASQAFMPLAYGGGIKSLDDVKRLFRIGLEKVVINTFNFESLDLISEASRIFGSQSIVGNIDVKKTIFGKKTVYCASKKRNMKIDPVQWAIELEKAGAGELILTNVDRESTFEGYDLELIKSISESVSIPVVANGGAQTINDFKKATDSGATAVAAGSMFVYQGKHNAVLITYPNIKDLEILFNK